MQSDKVNGSLQTPSFEQKLSFSELSIRPFFKNRYASSNSVITIIGFYSDPTSPNLPRAKKAFYRRPFKEDLLLNRRLFNRRTFKRRLFIKFHYDLMNINS